MTAIFGPGRELDDRIKRRHAAFVSLMPDWPGWGSPLADAWLDLYVELCKVAVACDRFERQPREGK